MSFKRGPKPARPPPPKGGLALGGMSFKKLEQEEDGEDLTISDKYASVVQQARSQNAASSHAAAKMEASAPDSDTNAADEDRSSPLRKSVFEYKELLSGLKDRIHGKITKTIEDISGESSASASPDKEHPLAGPLSKSADKLLEKLAQDELASKSSTLTRNASTEPTSLVSAVMSDSPSELPRSSLVKSLDVPSRPPSVRPGTSSDSVSSTKPTDSAGQTKTVEEKGSGSADKSVSVQLSSLSTGENGENILVVEEHFKEPLEDFTGNPPPTGLTTSTSARPRSKLQSLKKKAPKTSATVSMSGLMRTPEEEVNLDIQNKSGSAKGTGSSGTHEGTDIKPSHSSGMIQRLTSHEGSLIPWQRLMAIVAAVFAYFIVPLPPFLSGLISGSLLTAFVLTVYKWLVQPPKPKEPMVLTPIEDLPPMQVPEMKDPTLEDGIYKGWMNEITHYNPDDYHINHTYSVFVTLEGSRLRLQRPKTPVPRRAMHDENIPIPHFIHQRHFELKGSRVFLMPPGLVKKRVWSKKYPLCLALAEEGTKSRNSSADSASDRAESPPLGAKNDMGFEIVSEEKCDSSVLFLFARTGREKEEWFRRFEAAVQGKALGNHIMEMRRAIERKQRQQQQHRRMGSDSSGRQRHNSSDSQSSSASEATELAETEPSDPLLDFTKYMGHLMPAGAFSRLMSPAHAAKSDTKDGERVPRLPFTGSIICDSQLYWLNALIGRCFFDFLRDTWWAEKVKDKLQRKLSKIHVPYFIEELQVTAIDMGKEMPVIRRAANPYLDERGFWVELDVSYGGSFQMTIETKMNLMKLKRSTQKANIPVASLVANYVHLYLIVGCIMRPVFVSRSPVTDSEEEDSAESSTDEEEEATSPEEREGGGGSKKLLKYLDKLTQSKYFQQATEYKYIKRAMENVSNTPLQLAVQLKSLVGKLAVNVPPPPSDRLWYGFRGSPRLWLAAKPQVGERVVTITHITDWIERKLELEFQRVFVMPNMDDIVVPILRAGEGASAEPGEARSSSIS
ncbi:hypothetical protein BaRGS_00000867 [Batillaria attramentaria]|uniref:SMP-LTD domain-containing protein n=1 Tax=Batillaria attramentaria TaxID=370345 RepID=A0ABD0M850_9CAEN